MEIVRKSHLKTRVLYDWLVSHHPDQPGYLWKHGGIIYELCLILLQDIVMLARKMCISHSSFLKDPVLRKDCKRTITISFTYCSSFMCLAFQHTLSSNVLQCLAKIIMGLFANVSILSSHICLTFLLQRKKLVNLCQKKLSFMYGMSLYL
jgi:hypothetical protein